MSHNHTFSQKNKVTKRVGEGGGGIKLEKDSFGEVNNIGGLHKIGVWDPSPNYVCPKQDVVAENQHFGIFLYMCSLDFSGIVTDNGH